MNHDAIETKRKHRQLPPTWGEIARLVIWRITGREWKEREPQLKLALVESGGNMSLMPPYSSIAVANEFVGMALKEGKPITQMQLLKLLYFAHGWHLALTKKPLLDDQVEAWQFGPVVPSVYHAFKGYGSGAITEPASVLGGLNKSDWLTTDFTYEQPKLPDDSVLKKFLQKIWQLYGSLSGIQLSNLTHLPGAPWQIVWDREGKIKKHTDIPDGLIQEHFCLQLTHSQPSQPPQTAVAR